MEGVIPWSVSGYGRLWECGKDPFSFARRLLHEDPWG